MKTFDEAIGMFGGRAANAQQVQEFKAKAEDSISRYKTLIEEVTDNNWAASFINMMLQSELAGGTICPHCLMLTAFAHGVAVGVEMEKPESMIPGGLEDAPEPVKDTEKEPQ